MKERDAENRTNEAKNALFALENILKESSHN